jgi:hypothetical protein
MEADSSPVGVSVSLILYRRVSVPVLITLKFVLVVSGPIGRL